MSVAKDSEFLEEEINWCKGPRTESVGVRKKNKQGFWLVKTIKGSSSKRLAVV